LPDENLKTRTIAKTQYVRVHLKNKYTNPDIHCWDFVFINRYLHFKKNCFLKKILDVIVFALFGWSFYKVAAMKTEVYSAVKKHAT